MVSSTLAKYSYMAGKVLMNKPLTYRSFYMAKVFEARNRAISMEERRRATKTMYENYICQYKAILLQCEKEYDPFFNAKYGQYATVALTRSGANKLLRKVWEAFITRRDRIVPREHAKTIQNQKKV